MTHEIPDFLRTIVSFAIVLGVLVFVHEFGHYLAARWRGVAVEVFSIGFGRALLTWTDRSGTVWKLAWLPLGGYVKLHGQERPETVSEEDRARWIPGRTFHEKSVGSRAIIVAAGPIANFVLAAVLFAGLFAVLGRPYTLPEVSAVMPNSAAARAGLLAKDRIEAIDGRPVKDFGALERIIAARPDAALRIEIRRDGKTMTIPVVTGSREVDGRTIGLLGVQGGAVGYRHIGLPQAAWGGIEQTWDVTAQTAQGVAQIITGKRGAGELGGPIRIAQLSGEVVELGLANLVSFIAILSINLGLINLFPIPILDGGHLLFFLFEAARGRPLSRRAQEYGFRVGLALLGCLLVFATWNDLSHLGLFRWLTG